MNEREKFLHEKSENIRKMSADNAVRDLGIEFAVGYSRVQIFL